jgi:hypothetical protein
MWTSDCSCRERERLELGVTSSLGIYSALDITSSSAMIEGYLNNRAEKQQPVTSENMIVIRREVLNISWISWKSWKSWESRESPTIEPRAQYLCNTVK